MVIAERELRIGDAPVPIRLHAPQRDGSGWACRYEIGWPDQPRASAAYGVDAFQALRLALEKIGHELYMSAHHRSGALSCPGANGGYGFPVPRDDRDLLVGDDKRFDG